MSRSRVRVTAVTAALMFAAAQGSRAQQGGATGGASGGSGSSTVTPTTPTTPSPTTTTPTTTTPSSRTTQPSTSTPSSTFPSEMRRPIFLSGRVLMEDGTQPPGPVVIERMCNGVVRPEGYTDARGRFSFQFGQNTYAFPDASVGWGPGMGSSGLQNDSLDAWGAQGGVTERELMGCDIRASLAGYRSDSISLAGRRFLDRPDVGTIYLHRYGNVEGRTVSVTNLAAPKDAVNAYNKGRDAAKKQKWADARKQFEKAVQVYPQYAAAWSELGDSLSQLKDDAAARNAYEKAIAADAKYLPPHLELANIELRARDWTALAERTGLVLRLDPANLPSVYLLNSIANFNLRDFEASEKSAREALKLDPQHSYPKSNHILGVIMAQRGDFAGASENLKLYLQYAPSGPDAALVKEQLAKVEQAAQGGQAANR